MNAAIDQTAAVVMGRRTFGAGVGRFADALRDQAASEPDPEG